MRDVYWLKWRGLVLQDVR